VQKKKSKASLLRRADRQARAKKDKKKKKSNDVARGRCVQKALLVRRTQVAKCSKKPVEQGSKKESMTFTRETTKQNFWGGGSGGGKGKKRKKRSGQGTAFDVLTHAEKQKQAARIS